MKILLLDIENAPHQGYMWGLWQQNIGLNQLVQAGYTLCWAAKWYGEREMKFGSIYQDGTMEMLKGIHKLMDEADCIVHYNGKKHDIPILNKEFVTYGFKPPSPAKHVDLYQVAKAKFKFASNKMDYVSQALGLGKKHETSFELWVACMENDPQAWKKMERYNKQDVLLLELIYDKFKPWIKDHANHNLYTEGQLVCPNCGSKHVQKRGFAYTALLKFQRYQCNKCGNWFRSNSSLNRGKSEKYRNV